MDDAAVDRMREPLARAAKGDARAFEQIVREHQAMVFSIACHFLGEPGRAEELSQEVFLELYRNLTKIKSAEHLKFWLRRVAANRAIDWLRRREPEEISLQDAPEPVAEATGNEDLLLQEKLRRLMLTLPERPRMVLILRFQEGLELHEIAETLKMPLNSVKSSLRRSLAVLQEKLARVTGGVQV